MMNEQELVPYTTSDLRGERLLVLAPHPDDEVIGCGGLVALHVREKRTVKVVIASDGSAAENATEHDDDYRRLREDESRNGLKALGLETDPVFLGFADRELASRRSDLRRALRTLLLEEQPDLILAPSPVEVHPDHVALSRALYDVVHEDDELRGILAVTTVGFYEVSQPIQPNALVDITTVAELKQDAVSKHASQQRLRDYAGFQLGLSRYRALTLGQDVQAAEAYRVVAADRLRVVTWKELCADVSPRAAEFDDTEAATVPITVIIRTRNRENWLREAVQSVLGNTIPARIVVVNDGGNSPAPWLNDLSKDITVVDHPESRGRSAAMNAGVERAETEWIAFLDDDDVYLPEHLLVLANATLSGTARAYYTDAVYSAMERSDEGTWIAQSRRRVFQQDFDKNLLLIDNYIPLPTLLVRREDYLAIGGFDPGIDMFEDWDFLIRLASLGPLQRIPRVTCEVRQFPGSGSPILASPEGSSAYLEAKKLVWEKHRDLLTFEAFEAQKRRLMAQFAHTVDLEGRTRRIQSEVDRLDREKKSLIGEIASEHSRAEAARQQLDGYRTDAEARIRLVEESMRSVHEQLEQTTAEKLAKNGEVESLRELLEQHKDAVVDQTRTIQSLYAEIERLNGVIGELDGAIESMRGTRAWRLHQTIERLKGGS
jgi:LmbE family N-acetylglucosaminyl deacetylase/glycosyltransferase involved in cell wall biosynthesis